MKRFISFTACLAFASIASAGGRLETFKFTGESTVPGFEDVEVIGIFWDQRCSNVTYTVDDIPANRGRPDEIPTSVIRQELQTSFDQWNQIRTSYINMNITSVRALNNGIRGFDFINELTFQAPAGAQFLASSPSVSLQEDADFVTGDDIDGDGDSDVFDPAVARRNTCFDADGDGDIEFPAGPYKAGTILDNDVQFNPVVIWSAGPTPTTTADIQAVAVHEFGHSHGLSHSLVNQISKNDGTGSTMFPFIDTGDLGSEIGQRDLHIDDIAWSSFLYPEGTALVGPAALQPGDRPFKAEFGLIRGSISQAGVPVLGADVSAINKEGERVGEGYSGKAKLFGEIATGDCCFIFDPEVDPASSIVNGAYVIPVPAGLHDITIEAIDGAPAAPGNISITAQVGAFFGQNAFPEEFRGVGAVESNIENLPALSVPVLVLPALTTNNVNLVTNDEIRLRNSGLADFAGTSQAIGFNDVVYAERFTNAEVLARLNTGALVTSGLFETTVLDASVVPKYKRASLILGRVNADGTAAVDLTKPFVARSNFVGQDSDLTPLYFSLPSIQNLVLKALLQADSTLDVFLVLEANNEFETGTSGAPPLLALDAPVAPATATGRSYFSRAGSPLAPFAANWSIELHFTPPRE